MPHKPPVEVEAQDDGRVVCPKGHFCGKIDSYQTQFYCDSCGCELIVRNPTKAQLAKRLLDSYDLVARMIAELPA